jgi:hypothetical protein
VLAEYDRVVTRPAWVPDTVRTRVLERCRHIPMWDAPSQVAKLLIDCSRD